MEIGGAERALIGLLNSFDQSKYDIDLFLARHEGEFMKYIPSDINLLPTNQAKYLAVPMINLLKEKQYKMLYGRLKAKYLTKRTVSKLKLKPDNQIGLIYSHLYTFKYINKICPEVNYDLAISFLTPHYICLNKCNAKKKIAWIHTDYSTIDIDIMTELKMWEKFDYIASISDECTQTFLSKFPILKNKIVKIENIITKKMIENKANDFILNEYDNDCIKLLSIGRFSNAKNFDNVPAICKEIVNMGINVKWYIIGYGKDEMLIKNKIQEYNMSNHVFILGKKENPYPYIKSCDIYIQPSRYEGKAVSVREAQILCKPVVITNYPTSKSQINDGVDGIIVPMDNKKCAQMIVDFIKNKELQNNIVQYLKKHDYSNTNEVEKIYQLMED
ncbi:MAG: glycosyltransferase [[Clostridium] spiroforme]|nr:glycosyltransferase [Thomasclavelia spiroformis]